MRRPFISIAAATVLLLSGCAADAAGPTDAEPGRADAAAPTDTRTSQSWMNELAGTWGPESGADAEGCAPALSLGADGFWNGLSGSFVHDGSWIVDDRGSLRTESWVRGWDGPPRCSQAEAVASEFEAAFSVDVSGDQLALRDADGSTITTLTRASFEEPTPQPVPSQSATPTGENGGVVGRWVDDESGWVLDVDSGMLVTGTDGCNMVHGRWSDSGSSGISFGGIRTLRVCSYPESWVRITGAERVGDTLTITLDDASTVLLHRTSASG
ncbi:hypothetical protein HQQ80_00015 [Microbacteriaceae bacterium VKM Ac-2855]|nr:hypothetical protein [Microbacteriaceae bacterium VKM Ac-2855]